VSTITVVRTVAASPEAAFAAWVDPEQLAAWWWPQLAGTTYDLDARPGGAYRIEGPAIGVTVTGVYTEVDPPRRLAFTWHWRDGEPDSVEDQVVVTFQPVDGGTTVTVAHTSPVHAPEGGAERGWNDVLDRLVDAAPRLDGQSTSSRS
jgi:uncharacterized protein YndB with AHSA1/START domain